MNTLTNAAWAIEVEGLEPSSKLVLMIAAGTADMDGRVFDVPRLKRRANLTDEGFQWAVADLTAAGLATLSLAQPPAGGERQVCLQIIPPEVAQ